VQVRHPQDGLLIVQAMILLAKRNRMTPTEWHVHEPAIGIANQHGLEGWEVPAQLEERSEAYY